MTTQFTNPVTTSATHATIDTMEVVFRRNLPSLAINVAESTLKVDIVFRNGNGSVIRVNPVSRQGDELSAAVRNAIRDLQNALVTYTRAQGVLPAGTDTSDLP